MGKQMKLGKKRRSKPDITSLMYAHRCFDNETKPLDLLELFDKYDNQSLKIKDSKLKRDIELCMQVLPRLPHFMKTYRKNKEPREKQIYMSHFQDDIKKLDSVIKRTPLYIRVDFNKYALLIKQTQEIKREKIRFPKLFREMHQEAEKLKTKDRLPGLRFFAFTNSWSVPSTLDDDVQVRHTLTTCLFDHLQRIMMGYNLRYKKCEHERCKEWFLATDESHIFCSNKCKLEKWDSDPKNREKRKDYYDNYKIKKGIK